MSANGPQTVLLTSDLGSVGSYGPMVPLARVTAKGSLYTGQLFLRATLDEMIKIRSLSKTLNENHHDLLRETKAQFDDLVRQKDELELLAKRNWIVKLFKSPSMKRAKRAFVEDAMELWESATTTSDRLKKNFLWTSSADLTPADKESVAEHEPLGGVAVETNGPITQETIAVVQETLSFLATASLADPTPCVSPDGQTSAARIAPEAEVSSSAQSSVPTPPSSPGSASTINYLNLNFNYNVVNNTDTNTEGFTINNSSSRSSGCVTSPRSPMNNPNPP